MPSNSHTRVNRYGAIAAEIYDIDKPIGALPDTAFYLDRLSAIDGPILEPACGTGRTLAPLLDAGHEVTGFDASPDMLERCRARCAARGHAPGLGQQRFEDFRYDEPFAAIIVPVGTFTLIDDFAVAMAVLRRFWRHLRPGGLVMLDIEPLEFLAASRHQDRRSWTTPTGDLLTLEGARVATDWLGQKATANLRYERWRDHVLVETHLEPMSQRYWGADEFALALAAAGFGEIKVVGNYDRRRAPRPGDRTLTFEAARV
ncbi:MAG TPA: class I SAM-dependent methyltransferase [Caulobacteraceae bacterium]|nr:class I SAM-dependent methyltransferase [Caulobacteraceae bacterium]